MQVSFYQLKVKPLSEALPVLMEKVLQSSGRAVILCADDTKLAEVDKYLWSVGGTRFLPHGSANEDYPELQPIYLALKEENPNKANFLVVLNGQKTEFGKGFERVIDIFDGNNEEETANARKRFAEFKKEGAELKFFKQDDSGKWAEAA